MTAGCSSPYRHVSSYLTLFLITEHCTKHRIHPIPSRWCPANNRQCHKHVPSTQIYCMSSLIWCQSNPQASFIGIIYFCSAGCSSDNSLLPNTMKTICFDEIQNHCCIVYHLRGILTLKEVIAVYCICKMRWSDADLGLLSVNLLWRFHSKTHPEMADWKVCGDDLSSSWLSW